MYLCITLTLGTFSLSLYAVENSILGYLHGLDFNERTVMNETSIPDVHQMQPQGKKRRMDWDSLDLNENGSSGGIGAVDSKMTNVVTNGKDCERNRNKNVNGGKFFILFFYSFRFYFV